MNTRSADLSPRMRANLATATRFVDDLLCRQQLSLLTELVSETFEYHGPMTTVYGRSDYGQFLQNIWQAWTGWKIHVTRTQGTANTLQLDHEFSAVHQAAYLGVPATGRRFKVNGLMYLRFNNINQLNSLEVSYSTMSLLGQLGV